MANSNATTYWIYIFCFVLLQTCLLRISNGISITVSDTLTDGKDGVCTPPRTTATNYQSCPTGWSKRVTPSLSRWITVSSQPSCLFRITFENQTCYSGQPRKETCKRTKKNYVFSVRCYNRWLNWEKCDKSCGGGRKTRYKFFQPQRMYTREIRTCNKQLCPYWTAWAPENDLCDAGCTRQWKRECRNDSGIQNPTLCGGTRNDVVQRRPCPVVMCSNYILRATTKATTTAKTTTEYTTVAAAFDRAGGQTNETGMSVTGRDIVPRIVIGKVADDNNGDAAPMESQPLLWVGVLVGILALCIILLASYIGVQKHRKRKRHTVVTFGTGASAMSQRTPSSGANLNHANGQQAYQASSIDRLIARLRDMHQAATIRRTPPSNNVYLQPSATDGTPDPLLAEHNGVNQQISNLIKEYDNNNGTAPPTSSNYAVVTGDASTSNDTSAEHDDPIYADIPAYHGRGNVHDDSFTSDSEDFDAIDHRTLPAPPVGNQAALRRTAGSFVAHSHAQRPNLRRHETERRAPIDVNQRPVADYKTKPSQTTKGKSLPNHARLDDPADAVPQYRKVLRTSNSFNGGSPRTRPPRPIPVMHSVPESSQEDLSASRRPLGPSISLPSDDKTLYLKPKKSSTPNGPESAQRSLSESSQPKSRSVSESSGSQNTPPINLRRAKCAGGAVSAAHEFGFQRNASSGNFSEASSPRSSTASNQLQQANPDSYREPMDASRSQIEEAYSTYNTPFESDHNIQHQPLQPPHQQFIRPSNRV